MYRRIEIHWNNLQLGAKIKGTVSIIEGKNVTSMKVVAKFGIDYEMPGSYGFFRINGKYLPKLSKRTISLIDTMGKSYIRGLNQESKIYVWEEDPSWD